MLKEQLEPILMKVQKPARYVGGELNSVIKEKDSLYVEAYNRRATFTAGSRLAKTAEIVT